MRFIYYFLATFLFVICCNSSLQSQNAEAGKKSFSEANRSATKEQTKVDWKDANWIGYTKDYRPEQWSGRNLTFNRPPSDIDAWQPTEKELKSTFRKTHASPLLRRGFEIDRTIESAKIIVCGLGLYELYLNGEKVGDRVLDPAQTSYDKRAFYVVHDVTEQLQPGKNAMGLMLGNGFYGQNMAFGKGLQYGIPRAMLKLQIKYNDGSTKTVVSDKNWKAHTGPILFDNIYLGETYDARFEIKNWSSPALNDAEWEPVEIMEAPTTTLLEQEMEPMRKIRQVKPIAVIPARNGWIIDMGQNMTGWLQIKVNESIGTAIKMRFAELLMPDGKSIDPASTGIHVTGDTQTDIYICNGNGTETWEPRFTYHGFRYVQIEGLSLKPDLKDYMGWLVRTDAERLGTFECSDPLINKFYNTSIWTIEDNLQGLLSDCPHRERCAWMGDIYAVAEAASYNFNLKKMWRKLSDDMQTVIGVSPAHFKDDFPYDSRTPSNIAVGKRLCLQARPDWGAATIMLPWYSYMYYGDKEIIKTAWPMMVGWMGYVDEKVQTEGIINGGYGDWCPPGGNEAMDTPPALTSTALYYQSLISMQKMAQILNKPSVANEYAKRALRVQKAFNKKYYDETTGGYGTQTANSIALQCGLVPAELTQKVADNLAELIMKKHNGHYSTGIFGHRPLYTLLNDYGHANVTRHLWKITDYPSLGFLTEKHDLTTWPEVPYNWPEGKRYWRNSFNHPMHSGFAATFHESLGGIRPDSEHPGFKEFFLEPCFLPGLEWAKATYQSQFGEISSSWKREAGSIVWEIVVPDGATANVYLKQYSKEQIKLNNKQLKSNVFQLKSGTSTITIK